MFSFVCDLYNELRLYTVYIDQGMHRLKGNREGCGSRKTFLNSTNSYTFTLNGVTELKRCCIADHDFIPSEGRDTQQYSVVMKIDRSKER